MSAWKRGRVNMMAMALLALGLALPASATPEPIGNEERKLLPEKIDLPGPLEGAAIDPALLQASGNQAVLVRLKSSPAANAELKTMVENEQAAFMQRTATSSKEISCVQTVMNAVFLDIDASEAVTLAQDPDVVSVQLVRDYEMELSETVPYIGGTIVQQEGYDGSGVRMAVLDSGIDYTHAAFGGDGTIEAYNASIADPTMRDGLFPTAKVVEGFDFVGEIWPEGPLQPDDDPIDTQGHGTAVADIAGGKDGVAPGVDLYALKVCSGFARSCNGIAIIQGLEYASDPNGDGDISDAVHICQISIGTPYGEPFDDPVSQAVNALNEMGVLIVGSAGNSADKPYITSTSAAASGSFSVANTRVPSTSLQILTVDNNDYGAAYFPWSAPLESVITGPVQYGDGKGGNLDGCADYAPGSLNGLVVLVDRGECNFSLKVAKVTEGGGLACIVALITDGRPFAGADGGDRPVGVPAYMISLADADAIRATLPGGIATLDPDHVLPLVMTMDGSSSRGPQNDAMTLIKPEIGAPGGSTAAVAGTGTGTAPFSGTSGAAPMVAGSAALVWQKYPFLSPPEVKARLMNNAETAIYTDLFVGSEDPDKDLAPITRIGGGEVRVDRAQTARAAAWDEDTLQGALSFGFIDVFQNVHRLFKRIRIRNYSNDEIIYDTNSTFRYDDDAASEAVSVRPLFPGKIRVGPREDRVVSIEMTIIGERLPGNFMNSGSHGGDGNVLTIDEFDGYFILDDGDQPIHLAWHVLPRKAANVLVKDDELDFTVEDEIDVGLLNDGVGFAQIDSFSLLALSPKIPGSQSPDIRAVGVSTLPVGPGVCSDNASFIWRFAFSLWDRSQHLFNTRHLVFLDIDQDNRFDYVVLNSDFSGTGRSIGGLDGRQLAFTFDLTNDTSDAFFFAEHSTNTGNTILTVCAEQIGMTLADLNKTSVNVRVEVRSLFFSPGGPETISGITVTPGTERYISPAGDLGPNQPGVLTVTDRGSFEGNSRELGLMVITNADRGDGNRGGATQDTELIVLRA